MILPQTPVTETLGWTVETTRVWMPAEKMPAATTVALETTVVLETTAGATQVR